MAAAIRHPFQLPAEPAKGLLAFKWGALVGQERIRHERARDAAAASGWQLGPVEYRETGRDAGRHGEWRTPVAYGNGSPAGVAAKQPPVRFNRGGDGELHFEMLGPDLAPIRVADVEVADNGYLLVYADPDGDRDALRPRLVLSPHALHDATLLLEHLGLPVILHHHHGERFFVAEEDAR